MAEEAVPRKRNRNLLRQFYGVKEEQEVGEASIDLNNENFDTDLYMKQLLTKKPLNELMTMETSMLKDIRTLDSEMQTLVYENYNKFISATDTIRRMKDDFNKMEDQMEVLMKSMGSISSFSHTISDNLSSSRNKITKLSSVHALLTKLQFLFELPTRLKKCIEMAAYPQAVKYYTQAAVILSQYQHVDSFRGIREDCEETVQQLSKVLKDVISQPNITQPEVIENTNMLLDLKEDPREIISLFLDSSHLTLQADIDSVESPPEEQDILEFIDTTGYAFLGSISLIISTYNAAFVDNERVVHGETQRVVHGETEAVTEESVAGACIPIAEVKQTLTDFVYKHFSLYFTHIEARFTTEAQALDNATLVRGLDRFYRRLQPVHSLIPQASLERIGSEIVANTIRRRIEFFRETLHEHFRETLSDVKQALLASKPAQFEGQSTLQDIMSTTKASLVGKLKLVLINVKEFINADITFSNKPYFRGPFCVHDIKQGLVMEYLQHIIQTVRASTSVTPPLLLVLARLCLELENSTISYLSNLTDEMFPPDESALPSQLTPSVQDLTQEAHEVVVHILTHYVSLKGLSISQMIHTSVKTRDWLTAIEPRNVRAAMKRVVEEVTELDTQIGALFEEGQSKTTNSDSSRRALSHTGSRMTSGSKYKYPASDTETSLLSKLFSDQIEIFGQIQFTKLSILTGIIKIGLKAFLESVRLRTFGKYGLQQVQVDVCYLKEYLWRFVEEERLLNFLLEEVVTSTIDRCIEPVLMEPSVIILLCEPG